MLQFENQEKDWVEKWHLVQVTELLVTWCLWVWLSCRGGPGKELGTDGDSPWQPRDLCLSGLQPATPALVTSSISLHCCAVTACPCLWRVCRHVGFGILVKAWEIQKRLASLLWNRLVPFLSVSDSFSLSTQYFYYLLLYIPFSFLPRWQF